MHVPAKLRSALEKMLPLVQEEVNIHKISYVEEDSDFVQYDLKPQFKVMGPKYGKQMKAIAAFLETVDAAPALGAFAQNQAYEFELNSQKISLVAEDLLVQIRPREGYQFATMKDIFVALDTSLDEALLREGYARELVNKIQFSRKDQGFEIMDRILVKYSADSEIEAAISQYGDFIKSETLADEISRCADKDLPMIDINGREIGLLVQKTGV